MYKFLKVSFRHLWKSRLYSIINITGLATAITAMLLSVLYWKDERGFDSFHENNPDLYRVTTTMVDKEGKSLTTGGTGQVQGPAFKAGVPEVKSYVRIFGGDIYNDITAGDKSLHLQPLFADANFFDVFTFRLLRGNPGTVLSDVSSVVVTERTAKKFFNSIDVVGKLLRMDADPSFQRLGKPLMISGVMADPPKNSSVQFDILLSFKFLHLSFEDTNWLNAYLGTFVVLHPSADLSATVRKFKAIYTLQAKEQLAANNGYDPQISYGLQPITAIHLNPLMTNTGNAEGGVINGSNPLYSYLFMGIAYFILLMATINFINISIANSLKRAKEVGIRKIAGGSRQQIILQFLSESAMLCCVAFLVSLLLMNISLPVFNGLTGKQLHPAEVVDTRLIVYFSGVLVVIILLTGLYPAYILSNFKPSEVLYNKQKLSGRNLLGRSLVVIQFSLAVFLLIATIIYYGQMDYIRTKDLGYNPGQVIRTAFGGNRDYKTLTGLFKTELERVPSIKMASFGNDGWTEDMQVNGRSMKGHYKNIDENFLPAMEIPLTAGRNLSPAFSSDPKEGAIVNETFVKLSGMDDPIGRSIKISPGSDSKTKIIRGVVKDFHFGSLRDPIKPMVMYMNEWPDGGIWVKFERARQKEALAALEQVYKKLMPEAVYQYSFLDELNARQYLQEQRWQQVISIATFVSFIICCLGLFGLAHLSTNLRIREIGIRKVLGASVSQVVTLLSGDFLKLVIIAFVIAAPLSWIVMNKWLQDFAYRIEIHPGIFLLAGLLAILIALSAVCLQSVRAAISNPVKNLRTD